MQLRSLNSLWLAESFMLKYEYMKYKGQQLAIYEKGNLKISFHKILLVTDVALLQSCIIWRPARQNDVTAKNY